MGASKSSRFIWAGAATIGAMIREACVVQVSCTDCHAYESVDLHKLLTAKGPNYSLVDRHCRCRLTEGCDGWNRFSYLRGVMRPLWTTEKDDAMWVAERTERAAVQAQHGVWIDFGLTPRLYPAMCNRAERGETHHIRQLFGAAMLREFNEGPMIVHPKDPGVVVRQQDGQLVVEQMTWGFPVALASKRDPNIKLKPKPVNNARFDKLAKFWKRWAIEPHNRCLIPTARYAEAVGEKGRMTETWLSVTDQPIFAWAGLWSESDEWGTVYTGVMTDNAPELAHIHDRSPVIIDPADWMTWLTAPLPDLYQFDRPYPADRLTIDATDRPWFQKKGGGPDRLI